MKNKDWKPYNPKRGIQLYNIFTKSGIIYGPCYFKDGFFYVAESIIDSVDVIATQEVEEE